MSLLTALTILHHQGAYASQVAAAHLELSAWVHDRVSRPLVEPKTGNVVRVSPQDREDVAQAVMVKILEKSRLQNQTILDAAIGVGRVRSRRGGATATFVELGLLDPAVVLGPARPDLAGALDEANAALARYLESTLARRALSAGKRRQREVPIEFVPDLETQPTEPGDQRHLEVVLGQLERAFERGYRKVDDRTQWRVRFHELQRVSRGELSISALALREMAARDPSLAERDDGAILEAERLVASTGSRTSELVLSAVRDRDVSALETLQDQLRVGTDLGRAAADHALALLQRWQGALRSPEGKRARATIDTWNRRLREHIHRGIDELEALPPEDPAYLPIEAAVETRRAADLLLRRCQIRPSSRVLDKSEGEGHSRGDS